MKKQNFIFFIVSFILTITFLSAQAQCTSGNCDNGTGTYKYSSGTYTGQFNSGVRHGQGTYVYTNGNRFVGTYDNGEKVYGTFYYKTGSKYTGQFENDKRHGTGRAISKDGKLMSGYWNKGEFVGNSNPITTYAVIVGVNDYPGSSNDLRNCVNDARDFKNLLYEDGVSSSNIRYMTNSSATRQGIIDAMSIFSSADYNDKIYFFFSGHGCEYGFCPVDMDDYYSVLHFSNVKSAFSESDAACKICIADACHSGSIRDKSTKNSSSNTGSNKLSDDTQIAVFMSSRDDQTSMDGGGVIGNGLFTGYVVKGLNGYADDNNDGYVTITELYVYVRENVTYAEPDQVPVLFGKFNKNMVVMDVN